MKIKGTVWTEIDDSKVLLSFSFEKEETCKWQFKIIRLCDWPFEIQIMIIHNSSFGKPISVVIVIIISNHSQTKPVNIGWWRLGE